MLDESAKPGAKQRIDIFKARVVLSVPLDKGFQSGASDTIERPSLGSNLGFTNQVLDLVEFV